MRSEKIGTLLLEKSMITVDQLSLGLSVQGALCGRERLGNILHQYDLLSEEGLAQVLSDQSGWPFWDKEITLDLDIVEALGADLLRARRVVPLKVPGQVAFVLSDPYDTGTTDCLLARWPEAMFYVARSSQVTAGVALINREESPVDPGKSITDAVTILLDEALRLGATDIHIEPSAKAVEVRWRVDGVLRFYQAFPLEEHLRLVNIFFNRAEISAGDVLKCHDARFDHVCGPRRVDIRLSHIPSIHGSSLVLRLLEKSRSVMSFDQIGYTVEQQQIISDILRRPQGMLLFTGPTGCGKTTTLYAMLKDLKDVGVKVVSVEDPVEIKLPLVTQVPVDIRKGHDFDQLTRALLRHDPDVILIGEIRDAKTAAEAVRAGITGHRVLSTLHTHDAVGAILRLHDLGVDYSYVANTLNGVIAQRLVRRLCPHCRREEYVTPGSLPGHQRKFVGGPGQVVYWANPLGCRVCHGGYAGRSVVAQVLAIDEEMRFMIEQGLVHEIGLKARQRSVSSGLEAHAAMLVREGITSIDEAVRVVG